MTREEAIQILSTRDAHGVLCGYTSGVTEALDMAIEALNTEVVRCKDCRYFKKIAERSDSGLCHRDIVASAWKENGYCSRGERKGGDSE